jgi:hypothetical protein
VKSRAELKDYSRSLGAGRHVPEAVNSRKKDRFLLTAVGIGRCGRLRSKDFSKECSWKREVFAASGT